jgi:sec-independent protein translocase protein TatA
MIWGSIGPMPLILILVIVILLFGTKKLRNIGSDLGEALKNFRKSVRDGESKEDDSNAEAPKPSIEQAPKKEGNVYPGEVVNKDKDKQA